MFFARIVSGFLAFAAVIYGLSSTSIRQPKFRSYAVSVSNSSDAPVTASHGSLYYKPAAGRNSSADVVLNGIRISASDGTELVFQRPTGTLVGTVLMLHGCSHSATDFFPPGEQCAQCIGLPEELRMTRIALERGYGVIAVSSTNRVRKCWSTHPEASDGPDYDRVSTALREAEARKVYSPHLPLFAVGISSGGLFATSLPLRFRVTGVNSIVSSAVCLFWGDTGDKLRSSYPAHVFTHMSTRDKGTARKVQDAMKILTTLGTPSIEFNVSPTPVTARYLREAVPRWNTSLILQVISALRQGGHLDTEFRLQSDPRHSYWRPSVQHLDTELGDSFRADGSALSEELNRAWGAHEITSEHFTGAIDFLENQLHR